MFHDFAKVLQQAEHGFFTRRILVVGDLMLDRYLWGDVSRISPEAPVPVVRVTRQTETAGGAGNVALNLAGLGARAALAGYVGTDDRAHSLLAVLQRADVETDAVISVPQRVTVTKTRVIGGHQQVVRLDFEETAPMPGWAEERLLQQVHAGLRQADAVILSDYAKGVLTGRVCQEVIGVGRALGVPVLVDPKGSDYRKYRGATAIAPNRQELSAATGAPAEDLDALFAAGERLREELGLDFVAVTLSELGIALLAPGSVERIPSVAREVFDVSGAGDTVMAALAVGLACNLDLHDAVQLANTAAGVVVGKVGTAPIHLPELMEALMAVRPHERPAKVYPLEMLQRQVALWRAQGNRIVFTNGCFDVLHIGHVTLLEQARRLGDRLVVGLNTDRSVRALKGETRPVIHDEDRAYILASLAPVDAVVLFDEETPLELIKSLRPDVLVKGGSYRIEEVVGADEVRSWGGEVVLVPMVEGYSTTQIVQRIQAGTPGARG